MTHGKNIYPICQSTGQLCRQCHICDIYGVIDRFLYAHSVTAIKEKEAQLNNCWERKTAVVYFLANTRRLEYNLNNSMVFVLYRYEIARRYKGVCIIIEY